MSDDARGPAAAPDPRSHGGMPEGAECGGADDAALEAGRTQRALLAHVRHELRTPLNAIIGYSEMLLEDAADLGAEDWEESLRRILTSGTTLLALVNDLLDPTTIERTSPALGGDPVDLESFGAHLRHQMRTPLNAVIGYSEMLIEEAAGQSADAFVPELQKISAAGSKLLALMDDILQFAESAQGGEPGADWQSDPGADRPLDRSARPAAPELDANDPRISTMVRDVVTAIRPLGEQAGTPGTAPGHVLIVDDNETNRDLLARRLARQGYSLETAETGRQALELIRARARAVPGARCQVPGGTEARGPAASPPGTWHLAPGTASDSEPFDLILLDIMMPEMNGYQVLQELKADDTLRHIPVIMISALDEIDSIVRCIECGAEDYLTKPFNPVLLKARIDACLDKKRLRDREALYLRQIEHEKSRYEDLLHVILPHDIVQELTLTNQVKPRLHEEVAVLFCDIVGFTPYCEQRQPEEVLSHLQEMVEVYEQLVLQFDMEKIKTIGDSFMASAGLLRRVENPVLNSVQCGLEMVAAARRLTAQWKVRVGIHVGPVMAGVVGHRQYLFDLWGDTVNTAARVESHGVDGVVNVSRPTWERVADHCEGESLGLIPLKGKGKVEIFRIDALRARRPVPG